MCHLFAHQPQRDYESQTRSLRIDGHCTSIRLEMSFWDTLEEIAAKEGMSLAKFLTTLHNEVLDHHGEVFERHIGTGARVVEPAICILLDRDRFFALGHAAREVAAA